MSKRIKRRQTIKGTLRSRARGLLMLKGKGAKASRNLSKAFFFMRLSSKLTTSFVLSRSLYSALPLSSLRINYFGQNKIKVPSAIRQSQRESLAIKWLLEELRQQKKGRKPLYVQLAFICLNTADGRGSALKRKIDTSFDVQKSFGSTLLFLFFL